MKNIAVVYHAHCNDGLCSAAVVLKFLEAPDVKFHFIPATYEESVAHELLKLIIDLRKFEDRLDQIYIVDFCPKLLETCSINDLDIPTVIIDHHKTAKEVMMKEYRNIKTVYAEDKSGALLTWEYFTALDPMWKDVPNAVVETVSDRDLFTFKFPNTKAFHAGMLANPNRLFLPLWCHLLEGTSESTETFLKIVDKGKTILEYQASLFKIMLDTNGCFVKHVLKNCTEESIGTFNPKVINHQGMYHGFCNPSLASDFSDYVKRETGISLVCLYRMNPRGGYIYSVRSSGKEGTVPARLIAEYFGGGGHDNAAGFKTATLLTN